MPFLIVVAMLMYAFRGLCSLFVVVVLLLQFVVACVRFLLVDVGFLVWPVVCCLLLAEVRCCLLSLWLSLLMFSLLCLFDVVVCCC